MIDTVALETTLAHVLRDLGLHEQGKAAPRYAANKRAMREALDAIEDHNRNGKDTTMTPCITRVIERAAEEIGKQAAALDKHAAELVNHEDTLQTGKLNAAAAMSASARALRQQAHQLTGKDYR